jgi:uncharacterized phage protein gp47/JayE
MAVTQQELALQQIAQLRLLDPSVSAEVGTPERLLIDTFAQAIYDSQIDLSALQQSLNVDAKHGAQLDRLLSLFGFGRIKATSAEGFVTFSRLTASSVDIRIPANSMVQAPVTPGVNDGSDSPTAVQFYTLFDAILPAGSTSVIVPVRASVPGASGNLGINRITQIIGTTIFGITAVINETPTTGGGDAESDDEYKIRFKNTLFRNLAGTQDQYMALAVSTAFTSKANVIGPQSYYREYIQVPNGADNVSYDVDGNGSAEAGGGNTGEYTTALSTIPFAKAIYNTQLPVFVSNGEVNVTTVFYRQDTDFTFNTPPRAVGDTLRFATAGLDVAASTVPLRPNVTFSNVYTGVDASVTALRPAQVVLLEFAYMSEASRNSLTSNIYNAVDVYIDGGNEIPASTVITRPTTVGAFVDDPNSKYHYENYRRTGDPVKRPLIGNVFTPLFWQPVTDVPDQIIIGSITYFKNVHYWPVEDVSSLVGSVRARNGIEWSTKVNGKDAANPLGNPALYTGKIATDATGDPVGGQPIEIENYAYDKNIIDLQAALEGSKQITTDVLAHKAKTRYFKLDITVMYTNGISVSDTNTNIRSAVDQYLRSQYFGSTIQLSDLLQIIHGVPGVDNVRWTSDTPNSPDLVRVFETNRDGLPLLGVTFDRIQPGIAAVRPEIMSMYINGQPTSGNFTVKYNAAATSLAYNSTASGILTAISALSGMPTIATLTEDTRSISGVRYPIRSFKITWSANGPVTGLSYDDSVSTLAGGPFVIKQDFFLRDDELAALAVNAQVSDTVPGLIIRARAQNTWTRSR